MEGLKTHTTKLSRTPSSLLRSPTVRSSIHSLSDLEEQYPAEDLKKARKSFAAKTTYHRFIPFFALTILVFLPCFFFFYHSPEIPLFGNIWFDLCLLFGVLFVSAKKGLINSKRLSFPVLKNLVLHLYEERDRKLGFRKGDKCSSVRWFIGDSNDEKNSNKNKSKKIVREGVEFYSNGDFYEGEFHQGKCSGSGVYHYFVNGKYEGDWVDGRYDGYGVESWAKGSRYRGQYRQGLRHGVGVYRFYAGDCYAGEWFNGQSHGCGVQTCSDGSCYIGEFKCGVKHGFGCYHFRNGDRYAGEYFGDKMHGFGVYQFANGHCYEGSWHEGRKQGLGMYKFRNGETRCGEWDCGVLRDIQQPLAPGVLQAVQAARKAAEKALLVPRVDERVNKSVMSANRAATAARVAAIKAVQNRMDGKFCEING